MQRFDLDRALAQIADSRKPWLELLRVPALSLGVYRLAPGEADLQRPHTEDEVYHVVRGRARFRAEDRVERVGPGTVLFVERGVEHRFIEIEEELVMLVFFAP